MEAESVQSFRNAVLKGELNEIPTLVHSLVKAGSNATSGHVEADLVTRKREFLIEQ